MLPRHGTTIRHGDLESTRRSVRHAALSELEHALRTDGWARIVDDDLAKPTEELYLAAAPLFANADVCEAHRRDVLEGGSLALTYLGADEEPLYDSAASKQHVHSFNMHEVLTAAECDARLGEHVSYDADERALAHAYHAWEPSESTQLLRTAAAALRRALATRVCNPLLGAFASLLGLEHSWLVSRCTMGRSDNTSLLRCLEYPQPSLTQPSLTGDGEWGVSAHTDFECFSLLHEQMAGLELCAPDGTWHVPTPAETPAPGSWVLIVGDMLEILSSGYLVATPHRVRPTRQAADGPRRSLVLFQALDEDEALAPLGGDAAHRAPTGGFRRWWEERREEDAGSQRRERPRPSASVTRPLTQREWTEIKENSGLARLRSKTRAETE